LKKNLNIGTFNVLSNELSKNPAEYIDQNIDIEFFTEQLEMLKSNPKIDDRNNNKLIVLL